MNKFNTIVSGFSDKNYSLSAIILVIVSFFGVLWMHLKGIPAGSFYIMIFTTPIALISLIFLIIKEKSKEFYFSVPFSKSSKIGALRFWFGFIVPFILAIGTGGLFITSKIISPLAVSEVSGQSFATLSASFNPLSKFFIGVWTASTFEEVILGFLMVSIGLVIAFYILKNTVLGSNLSKTQSTIFAYAFAFAFSMIFFTMLHVFNSTYTSIGVFLIAGVFRLIMNLLMFTFLGIEFTIGVHMANNLIYFGVWASVLGILSSIYGWLIFIPLFAILIYLAVLGLMDFISGEKSWLQLFSMKS